ncbi:GNAT family N-acetyltransferase [Tomitella biformata]|uniref:GNAT family N-acetyltransferase n=1 Tax=Tomitella biformata TaxID=630403 RepID=UPI000571967D
MHDIRVLESEAELRQSSALFRTAMVGLPAPRADGELLLEPGRTLGAFLGDELVGTADATSSGLVLPGGARVAHAAVTHVGVLPTYTRRGVLTALMTTQLRDARERGEVVATLRASEAGIYGRFGYGMASSMQSVELDLRRARLAGAAESAPVRLLDAATAWETLADIASRNPSTRAGTIDRSALWWANQQSWGPGPGPRYVAVCGEPGAETGFARYQPIDTVAWFGSRDRTVVVGDLYAPTPDAHLALVRFLMSLDLVDTVVFNALPLDDPLPWLLTDYRAARVRSVSDETWLRLLDVPAAIAARALAGPGTVTIEVRDALLPENAGAYAISADGTARVDGPGELAVDVATLAAAFLGGARWRQLAAAGLVEVRDGAALSRADMLFAVDEEPFAGVMF